MSRWFCLTLLIGLASNPVFAADPAPMNVVLIVSDDHGWTDYGFMGHPHIRTPNLDRLASQSLVYRRGHVTSSLCCPSLATIISGRYPHEHKVTSNDPPVPAGMRPGAFQKSAAFSDGREVMNRHLEAVPTIPKLLATKGYVSLQTGKWWQGNFRRGGFTEGMTKGQRHGDEGLEIGRSTMKPIEDFMARAKAEKRPFFVWYAPMMPHSPHNPPARLLDKYRGKTESITVARYWAMVEWFDETVGQLLGSLEKQGLSENTVVLYVADNGWIQDPKGNGFVRSKQSPYEAGLRTPIMVRWPGRVQPRMSDVPALSIDIAPTVLEAAGVAKPTGLSGLNLADEPTLVARPSIQGACFTHNAVDLNDPAQNVLWRWLIHDRWKIIVPKSVAPFSPVELFDVVSDPAETKNLATERPDLVKDLTSRLDAWWHPAS